MDCNMPDFPVIHYLLELAQPHVHCVSDAIQPSHPLSSPTTSSFACPWRGSQHPLCSKGPCHLLPFFFFFFAFGPQLHQKQRRTHYSMMSCFPTPLRTGKLHFRALRGESISYHFFEHYFRCMSERLPPSFFWGVFFFSFLQSIFGGYFFHSLSLFSLFFFNNLEMRLSDSPWLSQKEFLQRGGLLFFSCWKQFKATAFRFLDVFFLYWKLKLGKF